MSGGGGGDDIWRPTAKPTKDDGGSGGNDPSAVDEITCREVVESGDCYLKFITNPKVRQVENGCQGSVEGRCFELVFTSNNLELRIF